MTSINAWVNTYELFLSLFNLKNDLSEKNDLSQDMPEKVKELNEEIMIWLLKTNAKVPRANPDYANK